MHSYTAITQLDLAAVHQQPIICQATCYGLDRQAEAATAPTPCEQARRWGRHSADLPREGPGLNTLTSRTAREERTSVGFADRSTGSTVNSAHSHSRPFLLHQARVCSQTASDPQSVPLGFNDLAAGVQAGRQAGGGDDAGWHRAQNPASLGRRLIVPSQETLSRRATPNTLKHLQSYFSASW